jgi:hypothetical protein
MVLGRLKREQLAMLNNSPTPPPPESLGDLIKALSDLVSDPKAGKKFLADLSEATSAHKKAEAAAKAAVAEQTAHLGKSLNEIDTKAVARNAAIDKHEADVAARLAARERAVETREQSVAKREAEAEALLAKAKEQHAAVRAQIEAFDRAATVRVS